MFQGLLCFGFGLYLFFASNPLLVNEINTIEGKGLNPLLQDPGLAFHPPFLYLGYVGLSLVWSFALAGILGKKIDKNWGSYVRPWVVMSWVFLTIGISRCLYKSPSLSIYNFNSIASAFQFSFMNDLYVFIYFSSFFFASLSVSAFLIFGISFFAILLIAAVFLFNLFALYQPSTNTYSLKYFELFHFS